MPGELEKTIVRKLLKGDVNAFDEIFQTYNKKIYSFSLSHLKSKEEAEGVVQEVFLKLWKNRSKLRVQADFRAFLFTITFNIIKNRFRKMDREQKHLEAYALTIAKEDHSSDLAVEYNNLKETLDKFVAQLPPRQKEILRLNREDGLTVEEISQQLNISKRTVENHLFRAKSFLKKVMTDEHLIGLLFFWLFIR